MLNDKKKQDLQHWNEDSIRSALDCHRGIAVAVSGGVDSMALLHKVVALREQDIKQGMKRWELAIIHVNFGLRGEESNADAQFVETKAKEFQLPLFSYNAPPAPKKTGIQQWARTYRYQIFEEFAQQNWAIALAHHSDDLAESMIFRMARGSSPKHLAGMSPWHPPFLRPFLGVCKADINSYADAQGISFRLDSSNTETKYTRNRIRHQIMPILEDLFPGAAQRIAQLGLKIAELGNLREKELANALRSLQAHPENLSQESYLKLKQGGFQPLEIIDIFLKNAGVKIELSQAQFETIVQQIEKTAKTKNRRWQIHLPTGNALLWQNCTLHLSPMSNSNLPNRKTSAGAQLQSLQGFVQCDLVAPTHADLLVQIQPCNDSPFLKISDFGDNDETIVNAVQREKKTLSTANLTVFCIKRPTNREKYLFLGHKKALTLKEIFMELSIPVEDRHRYFVVSSSQGWCLLCNGSHVFRIDMKNKELIILNNF